MKAVSKQMFMLRYVLRAGGILAFGTEATEIVVPDPRPRVES
jgi:hypothetical protein